MKNNLFSASLGPVSPDLSLTQSSLKKITVMFISYPSSQNQLSPIKKFEKIEKNIEKSSINPISGLDKTDMKQTIT